MKKILFLLIPIYVHAQDLAINKKKFPDFSLITSTHWRQLAGSPIVTIVSPDSLNTKILNVNRTGTYQFELAITFVKNGVTTIAKDTVNVIAHAPLRDDVYVMDNFSSSKNIRLISTVTTTAKVQVLRGTTVVQNYGTTAYSGVRVLRITGICDTCKVRITLNGKVYNL